jgi:hypothetical protein
VVAIEIPAPQELALMELAARQHDVVAHRQLVDLGFGPDAIGYRVRSGRLFRLYEGVYAVGRPRVTRRGRWMAAVLACGPGAVLSYRDAADLWQLLTSNALLIDVSAPGRSRNRRPGLRVHRPRRLDPEDVTVVDGIPVTTVARTIVDLAASLSLERLTYIWDAAERRRVFDLRDLQAVRARSNGRRGLRKVDALIAQARPLPPKSRSRLERDAYELFRAAPGIPTPSVNIWLAGMEVDLAWPDHRLVVELDHEEWHAKTRAQRERDNARDVTLQIADLRVLRVSDFRLTTDPDGILSDVRAALAAKN